MTHHGEENCTMPPMPSTLDGIFAELAARREILVTVTDDGTYIVADPVTGFSVSRRTRDEAEAEVCRLKAGRLAS